MKGIYVLHNDWTIYSYIMQFAILHFPEHFCTLSRIKKKNSKFGSGAAVSILTEFDFLHRIVRLLSEL